MTVISIVSLKGGVGKTTSALHLATVAADDGPTVLIDADEEASALRWAEHAQNLPFRVLPAARDELVQQVRALRQEGNHVLIDTPPNSRELLTRSTMAAHHVIVPVIPTGLDIDRMMPTLNLLRDIQAAREDLDVGILFTHWDRRKVLAREALEVLDSYPTFGTKIRDLTRYEQAFGAVPSYLVEYSQLWRELND